MDAVVSSSLVVRATKESFGRASFQAKGRWFEGDWLNGMMHGWGKEVAASGEVLHNGMYAEGKPVGECLQDV
jgi:hypothetical protein